MTHWKKLTNPDYLGSYAFERGEEKLATIDKVTEETVTAAEGRKSDCMVLYFRQKDLKPMILNHTNAKMIEKLAGTPYIEEWSGLNIALVVKKVSAFGDQVDAVRIKLEKVSGSCECCGKRITAAGDMTAAKVAEYTTNRFGSVLCADCAKRHK